ncbi:MAG: four helix bundle protein [Candidatus Omnitrophota bacterium]
MGGIQSFKDLKIWQLGMDIGADVYELTKKFPREELYGLTSQVRRSAVSIPANIAEGFRRYHPKEHKQFLSIAMGSAAELETELLLAERLKYISGDDLKTISSKLESLGRMLTTIIRRFK